LQYLLDALDARFTVFVHLDAKSDFAGLRVPGHARVLARRLNVFWGGWSMMRATLALIAEARAARATRYVLISGDSLPVRRADALQAALSEPGEYIEMVRVPQAAVESGEGSDAATARLGWVQPWRFAAAVHGDHWLLNPMLREAAASRYGVSQPAMDFIRGDAERLVQEVIACLHPPRPALFESWWYGRQWWALSAHAMEAILPALHDPQAQAFFRFMQVPDEHMLHTVLANTPGALDAGVLGCPVLCAPARGAWDDAGFRDAVQGVGECCSRASSIPRPRLKWRRQFGLGGGRGECAQFRTSAIQKSSTVLGAAIIGFWLPCVSSFTCRDT
jgi:hypothetical protein